MKPFYQKGDARIFCGNSLRVLPALDAESVSAVITDPPYHLTTGKKGGTGQASVNLNSPAGRSRVTCGGFMGKHWDGGDVAFRPETWAAVARVCRPGAHLAAFGGTRTFHRLACAIEDAGWEIRDTIMWVYGSGWPKSLNVSKAIDKAAGAEREVVAQGKAVKRMIPGADQNATGSWVKDNGREYVPTETKPATDAARQWDGWGTALKPSYEPVILARKPLAGTVAENVQKYGTGALNIDACRVPANGDKLDGGRISTTTDGWDRPWKHNEDAKAACKERGEQAVAKAEALGRWPANLAHDGSDEVVALFPQDAGAAAPVHTRNSDKFRNSYGAFAGNIDEEGSTFHHDTGSAARFFKTCKPEENELIFCKAKAILSSWNQDLANTADENSYLQKQHVDSVLSDAVILASQGRLGLLSSTMAAHFTSATPNELRKLSESLITAILILEKSASQEQQQERHIPNGCHVVFAETRKQTGITTITISRWKSNGSADAATFAITLPYLDLGAVASSPRFIYTAKASKSDRGHGNDHPTVKPLDLMRYLCRLIAPPGGIVLDPFMGSGPTLRAAVELGNPVIGIELDQGYCSIAAKRLDQGVLAFGD